VKRISACIQICLSLSIALPACAQSNSNIPKAPDKTFFTQDSAQLSLTCAEEAKRLNPKDQQLEVEYGEIQLGRGNLAQAQEAFTQALKGAEDDPRVRHWIGQAWLRHGFSKEALASYDAMVKVSLEGRFETRKSLFTNAAVDLVASQPETAANYMAQAYKLSWKDADNCLAFARAALLSEHRDLAALYFSRAAQADPKNADVWLDITNAFADYQIAHRPK
jgi:tetratricopeptide (TPR) repeat protein